MVKLGHHETLKLYNCLNIRDVSFTVYAKLGPLLGHNEFKVTE